MRAHHRGECRGSAPVSLLFEISSKLELRCQALEHNLSTLAGQLERCGRAFRLDLPTAIQDLPVDYSGLFQRGFGDGWQLLLRRHPDPLSADVWVGLKHAEDEVRVRLAIIRVEDVSHLFRHTCIGPARHIGRDFIREEDFAPDLATSVWISIFRESYERAPPYVIQVS